MEILVTGGAGYVGSHCVLELLNHGFDAAVIDNLSTGHIETVNSLQKYGNVKFFNEDLLDFSSVNNILRANKFSAVMHFAAFSQIGESVENPQKYYENNVCGTINLLKAMLENNVKKMVFSSTAAIYGNPEYTPIDEEHPKKPINPYGHTKLIIENILDDYDKSYGLRSVRLRYFNVAGADSSGRTGEWHEPETHLIPNILKSVSGNGKTFELYGDDYNTKDGTCIRDYINVEDLAKAHVLALDYLNNDGMTNCFNLGTNNGYSVKEVFDICEKVTGKKINVKICPKRDGDTEILVAKNSKAKEVLNWQNEKTLENSIKTAYEWELLLQKAKK